ncbi:hypothetical protein RB594_000888 [Gaeumannomyces avenae]
MVTPLEVAPINAGFFTRRWVLLAHKIFAQERVHRWMKSPSRIVFISPKLCIKKTAFTRLAEAHAMRFVSQNTTIPVPKVHSAFEHKGHTYILMERVDGQPLSIGWVQRSETSKARILNQLKALIAQLGSIRPPPGVGVSNVTGGPIYDLRLPIKNFWGPFPTMHGFHKELRSGVEIEHITEERLSGLPGLSDLIAFQNRPWPTPVFTHGDLSSQNIMARGDEIVAIIDWETAGWMPPYWEYTTAWHVNPQNMFWQEEVDKFLTPLPCELEMEIVRRKYYGDI